MHGGRPPDQHAGKRSAAEVEDPDDAYLALDGGNKPLHVLGIRREDHRRMIG